MQKNIKLIKYIKYGENLLLFEHLNSSIVNNAEIKKSDNTSKRNNNNRSHLEKLESVLKDILNIYQSVCDYIESLGDDVTFNQLKLYLAYKKVKNIVCIEIYNSYVMIYLRIDPNTIELEEGFTRNVKNIGHFGTGDLSVKLKNLDDFNKAKQLIYRAYIEG